jgi:hypothetical protein
MHTLEREIRELQRIGALTDATASRAAALERREVFSLYGELRAATYAGVALVTTGAGLLLREHLDRIGPATLVLGIALVAVACYGPAIRARARGTAPSLVTEYVLLLGVLLASADLAYAEAQFRLLGPLWSWHLLWLGLLHAATAYALHSPLVLAAALASIAGWFGLGDPFGASPSAQGSASEFGLRALLCAATMYGWREADRRLRPGTTFTATFDHYAINLAFWGGLAWCVRDVWTLPGLLVVGLLGAWTIREGMRAGREAFVVYGVVYSALGACFVLVPRTGGTSALLLGLLIVGGAAIVLWQLRQRLREPRE